MGFQLGEKVELKDSAVDRIIRPWEGEEFGYPGNIPGTVTIVAMSFYDDHIAENFPLMDPSFTKDDPEEVADMLSWGLIPSSVRVKDEDGRQHDVSWFDIVKIP